MIQNCDYSFKTLEENLGKALDSIRLSQIRKYCNHCWRYMIAYAENTLTPEQVERAMTKFTSHRKLKPNDCIDEFNFLKLGIIRETIGMPQLSEEEKQEDERELS